MLRNFTGSTGARAVIAVLMLLFVVACGGSDSGLRNERDQARADAAAAEEARLAAEAAAKKAAEDAAAAAAAAEAAAAEAAAQAERDKQAAIEQARQEAIAEQQRMAVMAAITAAQESVAGLMDTSSDADVAGAMAEIAKATAAIAAATSFSADDTAMYTTQVTAVQASLTLAEANIRAYRAEMAAKEAQSQATASARAKQAVDEAIAALAAANEAEAMSTATYTAAAAALSAAQTAVGNADADTLADASAALAAALTAAADAAADLAVKTQAVADATNALEVARATLAAVDPTHVALQAANAALELAKTEAQKQADAIKALQQQIADLQQAEQNRMTEAERMAEEARMKEMAANGKALKKALGSTPLMNLRADSTASPALHRLTSTALTVGIPNANNSASNPSPSMKAGDSAGALSSWAGKHYAHKDAGTKVSNSAIVYTNQGPPTVKPFATGASFGADQAAFNAAYTASTRTLDLGTGLAGGDDIAGDMFPTVGTMDYRPTAPSNETIIRGTYQGAPGAYRCTGATGCGATATSGGGVTLVGAWTFTHDSGAMTSKDDANYLFFGWWLTKDKDGDPTSASAFTGVVGTILPYDAGASPPRTLPTSGTATYAGGAAGKFAINNPLGGSDAGHFTADATLTAKFGGSGPGITGTLDNFMANEQAVPWSVSLNNNTLVTDDATSTVIADPTGTEPTDGTKGGSNIAALGGISSAPNYAWTTGNESKTTVWSIDGNSASASGTWGGQMYDEKPGTTSGGDGSNVPTTVTGTFHSEFGSTHTMVGAFGATKE